MGESDKSELLEASERVVDQASDGGLGVVEAARNIAEEVQSKHGSDKDERATLPEVVEPVQDEPVRDKVKTKYEGLLGREEAVAYFESIVEGLKKGTIQFRQGEESLTLTPASHIAVTIKGSRKGTKQKVSFKMSWRSAPESDLTISTEDD